MTDYFNDPAYAEDVNRLDENVTQGAEWLDGLDPVWYQKVNKELLVMRSGENCICGQVFREKALRAKELVEHGYDYFLEICGDNRFDFGSRFGFSVIDNENIVRISTGHQWNILADLWKIQVDKRLADAGLLI